MLFCGQLKKQDGYITIDLLECLERDVGKRI